MLESIIAFILAIAGGVIGNIITPYAKQFPYLIKHGYRKSRIVVVKKEIQYLQLMYGDPSYAYRKIDKELKEALLFWIVSILLLYAHFTIVVEGRLLLNASFMALGYGSAGIVLTRGKLKKMVYQKQLVASLEKKLEVLTSRLT